MRGSFGSATGRSLGIDVEGIDGGAASHEQAVALNAAEAQVGAALGQVDAADELALGVEDGHAVEILLAHAPANPPVSYTHLRAHETDSYLVCRLLLEKKKN